MKQVRVGMLSVFMVLLCGLFSQAQQSMATATGATVPPLIQFSNVATDEGGNTLSGVVNITFSLYSSQQGGEPLWTETQNDIQLDATGHYSVQLGITKPNGVPTTLFTSGEARWLGVQIAEQAEQPRVLLLSVPYALKAGDAATIGGLPPSAFMLATPNSSASVYVESPSGQSVSSATSASTTDVTTSGGTINFLPLWDATSDITSSVIFQSGSGSTAKIGINTITPATTLDIKGGSTVRGTLSLPATGTATATAGKNSQPLGLAASAFNSSTSAAVDQSFRWQAEPVGNDTSTPSATLNLLFGQGTSAPSETGLHIASTGLINFATGQTFPGTGDGTITGVTTAGGSGLTGGGTGGTLSLSLTNGCAANQVLQWNGSSWICAAVGTGTITGVTAGTDLTGGGSSGNVTLNLNTAATNALYARLAAANTFTGNQTVNGILSGSSTAFGVAGSATAASGFSAGVAGTAASPGGYGVEGVNAGSGGIGVYGYDSAGTGISAFGVTGVSASGTSYGVNANATGTASTGVSGSGTNGVIGSGTNWGVTGTTSAPTPYSGVLGTGGGVGVEGQANGGSVTGENFYQAGVWGDGGNDAVLGTNDEAVAGEFINNDSSGDYPTVVVVNDTTATHNPVFQTDSPNTYTGARHCTIDTSANLTCTGVVAGIAQQADGKQTAIYAMESAENWLEDAGSGQLSSGSVRIELDPAFAQTVNAGVEYHVFLTPNGDSKGLYVSQKTATSFEVHEQGGGTSSIAFDYRIMAKRKGYENVRLEDVTARFKQPAALPHKARALRPPPPKPQSVPAVATPPMRPLVAPRPVPAAPKLLPITPPRIAQASKPAVNQK